MFEKFRRSLKGKKNEESRFKFKTVVAYVIFGAIILVFALFGITPDRMGSDLGGNAAVVNGEAISIASFQRRLQMVEQNSGFNLDQFPPAQREFFARELKKRTLEEMIMREAIFQRAQKIGIRVADEEVGKTITSISFFHEKDRFQRQKYEAFLNGSGQSASQFEREIRKDLMLQKLQGLFWGSLDLGDENKEILESLDHVKIGFRYANLNLDKLMETKKISAGDIQQALSQSTDAVKADYEAHKIDYYQPERIKARHILIKIGEGQSREEAQKKVKELHGQITLENFSKMAEKFSDDPGSKSKGGDLGFFEKGKMVPAFEKTAFALPEGKISEPVETDFGFHVILVDKKELGGQKSFDDVKEDVAKKYLARQTVTSQLKDLKEALAVKDVKKASSLLRSMGVKWEEVKSITLNSDVVPGLPQGGRALQLLASRKGELGLVPEVKEWSGESLVFDLTSWSSDTSKKKEDKNSERPGERLAGEAFQKWVMSLNDHISIERNARLIVR